jgi:hypothetical protein
VRPVHVLQVDVYPNGNKQHPGERMETPLVFRGAEPEGGVPAHMQFVRRLAQHSRLRQEAQQHFPGSSLAIQRYIICPSAKGGLAFEDRPLSSSKYLHGGPGLFAARRGLQQRIHQLLRPRARDNRAWG